MNRRRKNNKQNKKKSAKFKAKKNKKCSLYQAKDKLQKRECEKNDHNLVDEKQPVRHLEVKDISCSEEEDEDYIKQLLGTFNTNITKLSVAIDSDEASDEEYNVNKSNDKEVDSHFHENHKSVDANNLNVNESLGSGVQDSEDPFANHVMYEMNEHLLNVMQSVPVLNDITTVSWPVLGNLHVQIPQCNEIKIQTTKFDISGKKTYATCGKVPVQINLDSTDIRGLHIKTQISENLFKANKSLKTNVNIPLTPLQAEIFSIINNYQDFCFYERTFSNAEEIRFVYCLHAMNHILKTRTKILHHNARMSKRDDMSEEFRDQGLVRPKVLMIVPFKDSVLRIVKMLIDITIHEDKGNVSNKIRFMEDYSGNEIIMPRKNPKPEDYELTFSGNIGDDFKIGITLTKKSLKLYADFYSSDIIIASPLGLRTIIGAEGEPERDFDFLASIELLIMDQAEMYLMQNWDHVLHIFNHLHLQPKESHGTDFSRVRMWSLNGLSKFYRQTLIFSSLNLPEINFIFNKKCYNYAGKIKTINSIQMGSICQVFIQLPHIFYKFEANNIMQVYDARFEFFVNKILPQQRDVLMRQTLICISNYFDYVRLRNYFKREDIGFVQICEYSKEGKVARARDIFFHGDSSFILYTERYHFFNRIRIKGIRHIIFYQPPMFPHFYYEMCNLMQEANMNKKIGSASNMTVSVIYSKFDMLQLAAIVGTDRAAKMVQSDRNVHMLITDGNQSRKGLL